MLNATAEAPVRANKTPVRAKAQPTPTQAPATTDSEADQLVRLAARQISSLLIPITNGWPWSNDRVPGNVHITEADGYLVDLSMSPEKWVVDCEGPQVPIEDLMFLAEEQLRYASTQLDDDRTTAAGSGERVALILLVSQAGELMLRLQVAYLGLPGTLGDLRALSTVNGMRPHRDRLRPPIRRGPSDEEITAAANPFASFGRNMPGRVNFDSKEDLARFVEKSAGQISCLGIMLSSVVERNCITGDGPDGSHIADFADFVSDQVYENQQAVRALLKVGGAA